MRQAQRGFTLIELIVSMAISVVLIALAGSLIIFSMNFLNRTELRATDKELAEQSADFIKEQLLYAGSITLVRATEPPRVTSGGSILFIGQVDPATGKIVIANEGQLYYMRAGDTTPVNVFGANGYDNNSLALDYRAIVDATARTPKSFEITAKTIRNEMVVYTSQKTFNLYEAGSSTDAEPRASVSIDSWSDGAGFDSSMALFYLLINTTSTGYVQTGLIAHFDAINNDISSSTGYGSGNAYHNPNAKTSWSDISGNGHDMVLTFTNNTTPIRDASIYFDGNGDFGLIPTLNLSAYSAVTVEICFREANSSRAGMLFEYSDNWNSAANTTAFGAYLNTLSSGGYDGGIIHTNFRYNSSSGTAGVSPFNYPWGNSSTNFTTHTNVYNMTQNETLRVVYINGTVVGLIQTGTATTPETSPTNTHATTNFTPQPFYLASRGGGGSWVMGEISSIRIYGRQLTATEVAQNAQEDYVRFGR